MINIFNLDKNCEFPLLHGKENPEFSLLYQSPELSSYLVCRCTYPKHSGTGKAADRAVNFATSKEIVYSTSLHVPKQIVPDLLDS